MKSLEEMGEAENTIVVLFSAVAAPESRLRRARANLNEGVGDHCGDGIGTTDDTE
jgi:hypothetical protein